MSARVEIFRETKSVRVPHGPLTTTNGEVLAPGGWTERLIEGKGKYRWRFVSNGHEMGGSEHGYVRRIDALSGARLVLGAEIYNNGEYMQRRAFNCNNVAENIEIRDLTRAKP